MTKKLVFFLLPFFPLVLLGVTYNITPQPSDYLPINVSLSANSNHLFGITWNSSNNNVSVFNFVGWNQTTTYTLYASTCSSLSSQVATWSQSYNANNWASNNPIIQSYNFQNNQQYCLKVQWWQYYTTQIHWILLNWTSYVPNYTWWAEDNWFFNSMSVSTPSGTYDIVGNYVNIVTSDVDYVFTGGIIYGTISSGYQSEITTWQIVINPVDYEKQEQSSIRSIAIGGSILLIIYIVYLTIFTVIKPLFPWKK